ncbi:MAG: hypothetical protein Q9183_006816, partial [Haloplaca sp. 2 TL-2023]
MTILISDMGDTVIGSFKRGTFTLADWTVLPKAGLWRSLLERQPRLWSWLQRKAEDAEKEKDKEKDKEKGKGAAEGFPAAPSEENRRLEPPTIEQVADLDTLDEHALARQLGLAIRNTANDLGADPPKTYTYEEWAKYTRLIRFSRMSAEEEEEQGLIDWDWIGENSPLMAEKSEAEWLLDRL